MQTYDYLLSAASGLVFALSAFFAVLRSIAILQQCGYSERELFKWYFSKGNIQRQRVLLLTTALVLLVALFCVCFCFLQVEIANALALVPVVLLTAVYLFAEKKRALKVPAHRTPRLVRLSVCCGILLLGCGFGVALGFAALSRAVNAEWFYLFRFLSLALLPALSIFVLALSSLVMKLYELPHNSRFIRRARQKLQKSACIKVGITGSFGKTSVKHFAAHMLSCKYKVLATPASYNTPMGVARTVLESGLDCDIFLAEMGARHMGDIRELCELVSPSVGVVTGVCEQHIETFGSLENIKKEKSELARYAKKCILGTTADFRAEDALREGKDFSLEDLHCTCDGTEFTLRIFGDRARVKTRLLGACAAEDVALAAALCYVLGMSMGEIVSAASALEPVPHRLQKLENGGVTILDDAYNSNIEGAMNALATLRLFGGKKFVVTPGLVELGTLEDAINARLGAALVGFEVILVGETLILPVRRGYLGAGGEESRLVTVPTLAAAQEKLSSMLSPGDCVLFLNDLPDCYR